MSEKKHIEEIRRELGKWAFVEKAGRAGIVVAELFSNALLVVAAIVFLINGMDGLLWASLIALVALVCTVWSYSEQRSHIECHEKGIMEVHRSGVNVFRFEDFDSFTFGVTNHFTNGRYQHTVVDISLRKAVGGGAFYSFKTSSQDAGKYGIITDLVSPFISKKMHDVVREKGSVSWGGQVFLSPRGIHRFFRTGKKKEREEVLLSFSEDTRYVFKEGTFHVFNKGDEDSLISIPCSAENFNPGFSLMKRLYAEAEENGTLIGSKLPKTTEKQERKPEERTTCPSCGFRRKWSLFKKYGALKQTLSGNLLTCYSCHEAVFPIEEGV